MYQNISVKYENEYNGHQYSLPVIREYAAAVIYRTTLASTHPQTER